MKIDGSSSHSQRFSRLSPLQPETRSEPRDKVDLTPPGGDEPQFRAPRPPHRGGKLLIAGMGALGVVGGLAGLLTPSPTAHVQVKQDPSVSDARMSEQQMGDEAARLLEKKTPLWKDVDANRRLNALGARLATTSAEPGVTYQFKLLDSKDINAMSLPGGHIYVTRALYEKYPDDAELTFILAHEMAHLEQHHSVERMTQTVFRRLLTLPLLIKQWPSSHAAFNLGDEVVGNRFGVAQELEADRLGQEHLKRMGINPQKAVDAMIRLQSLQQTQLPPVAERILSDHPATPDRIEALRKNL